MRINVLNANMLINAHSPLVTMDVSNIDARNSPGVADNVVGKRVGNEHRQQAEVNQLPQPY
jgi:hypothetical protein